MKNPAIAAPNARLIAISMISPDTASAGQSRLFVPSVRLTSDEAYGATASPSTSSTRWSRFGDSPGRGQPGPQIHIGIIRIRESRLAELPPQAVAALLTSLVSDRDQPPTVPTHKAPNRDQEIALLFPGASCLHEVSPYVMIRRLNGQSIRENADAGSTPAQLA